MNNDEKLCDLVQELIIICSNLLDRVNGLTEQVETLQASVVREIRNS